MVPVLVVTGPVGVGKSAVLREADALLVHAGMRHATIELDEIMRFWSGRSDQEQRLRLAQQNLASLWANFAAAGARRLLLGALLEKRSDLTRMVAGIPGASTAVVRLHAPLPVLEQRLRGRDPEPANEHSAARWWVKHLQRTRLEDHMVSTDGRTPGDVAREVLRVAGWLD